MNFFLLILFSLITVKLSNALSCSFVPNTKISNDTCSYGYSGTYCDECGLRFNEPNVKIVGGIQANEYSWPSMALIVFNYKFYYSIGGSTYLTQRTSYCGGTLISRRTVLTAAHCFVSKVNVNYNSEDYLFNVKPNSFYPTYESMYSVYLGLQDNSGAFDGSNLGPGGIAMSISSFKLHSSYDSSSNLNDIALIILKNEVVLNCYIQPACLPNKNITSYPTATNLDVYAAGWGKLSSTGTTPDNLYNVKLKLYDSSSCRLVSPSIKKDWNRQICAGEYLGGKDTCQGDSGGPLFLKDSVNGKQKYVLVGVTSYGDGCGEAGYPGIYTKVSYYLTWIESNGLINDCIKSYAFNRIILLLNLLFSLLFI